MRTYQTQPHVRRIAASFGQVVTLAVVCVASWRVAGAEPTLPDGKYGFGTEGIPAPAGVEVVGTPVRAVALLADVYARATDPLTRIQLLRDLGQTRLAEALPHLQKACTDSDPLVRAEAARSIGENRRPEGAALLKPLLSDPDAGVRREVVIAGAKLGDPSFSAVGFSDTDAGVIAAAIRVASSSDHADALAIRLPNFSPVRQVDAIRAIGRLGAGASHTDAIAGFLSGNLAQRVSAAEAAGLLKASSLAPRLVALLEDEHPTVRRTSITSLGQVLEPDQKRGHALVMLNDTDPTVRAAAARVLVGAPHVSVVEPLTARLTDRYTPVHDAARDALLAAMTNASSASVATDAAVRLLSDTAPERRADGSWLLGRRKSSAGLRRHIDLMTDNSLLVTAQAAESLGLIGRAEAGDALVSFVTRAKTFYATAPTDENLPIAHANAIVSAALLGRADVLPPASSMIGDKLTAPPRPRAAVIWASGFLGDQSVAPRLIQIIRDLMDSGDAKFESIKALGNLRSKTASGLLKPGAIPEMVGGDDTTNFVAHWAADRIHNTTTPYEPAPVSYTPNLSVRDLTR